MFIVLTSFLAVFLFLFSSVVNAAPYGSKLCAKDPAYHCYKVKRGDNWNNLFSNSDERDVVMKVNRTSNHIYSGMRIAIPNNIKTDSQLLDYAPMSSKIAATGSKTIIVSLSQLAFGAYDENGTLTFWGPVSGGRGYCPDIHRKCTSPTGNFEIYNKEGAGCKSTKFPVGRGGAPMPYCMFFHNGFALHGSYEVPGYNASHGCIRLFVNDAKWLNQEFTAGAGKVAVIIHN